MVQPKSILLKLTQGYGDFTNAEKKIADYILAHTLAAQYMTITELAGASGVAEATLTRFCRRLGCSGFGAFKLSLAREESAARGGEELRGEGLSPEDSVEELCYKLYNANQEALNQTYRLVDPGRVSQAVDIIGRAGQIYCCGQGGSSIMAMEAWGRFITVTNKIHWIQDSHMQAMAAALLEKDDAILFFSFSGATRDLMDIARIAQERGVRMVLITGATTAPAAAFAEVLLLCGAVEGPLQMGSVAAKVSQLYIIDVLFNEFCRRDRGLTDRNQALTAEAISNKYL